MNETTLNETIQSLYDKFSKYQVKGQMTHCEHCVSQEDIRKLLSVPLRELTPEQLEKYSWKAMTTWGDVSDFKHFMPRICELMTQGANIYWDIDSISLKFSYAQFCSWPDDEIQVVRQFFQTWWNELLDIYPLAGLEFIHEYLIGFYHFEKDIRSYLDIWRGKKNPTALLHLCELLESTHRQIIQNKWVLNSNENGKKIIEWLLEDKTLEWMEKGFFRYAQTSFAETLSWGYEYLDIIRKNMRR